MVKVFLHILLLYSLLASAQGAAPVPATCKDHFAELEEKLAKNSLVTSTTEEIIAQSEPTVRQIGSQPGQHGGQLIVLERTGPSWGSRANTRGFDFQGDPRWFVETVGPEAASFFGFRILDNKTMTVPDFQEFTAALAKVNARLASEGKEVVPVNFYQTIDNANVKVGRYVRTFLENRGLPMAPFDNHRIHDLSFHTGAIFLPKELLDTAAARIEYHEAFAELLKNKYSQPPRSEAAISYSYFIKFIDTSQIDNGTAMVGPEIADYLRDSAQDEFAGKLLPERYFGHIVESLVPDLNIGEATIDSPAKLFHDYLIHLQQGNFNEHYGFDPKRISAAVAALDQPTLLQDLQEFSSTYRSANYPDFRPNQRFFSSVTEREEYLARICAEITRRRMEIRDAVMGLMP